MLTYHSQLNRPVYFNRIANGQLFDEREDLQKKVTTEIDMDMSTPEFSL